MGAKKAEKKTKEAVEKYKASKKVLMKIDATCKAKAKLKYLTSVKIKKVAKIVASLEKTKVKACKAEKKAHEKAQKGKEKLLKAKKEKAKKEKMMKEKAAKAEKKQKEYKKKEKQAKEKAKKAEKKQKEKKQKEKKVLQTPSMPQLLLHGSYWKRETEEGC